jgi:YesN/AraC family two-component response regulator
MPGMDGFELIRNARMIQPGLLAIMTTGFSTEQVKHKGKEDKVDGFFSKPVDWDELHALLDTLSGSEKVQNVRKGIGLYRPERILPAIILFILILFGVQPSKAQPPFYPQNRPMLRSDSQEACWQSSDLVLSEAQKKELENLQRSYSAEAMPLRRELFILRIELRHLIRVPNVEPKILLERQKRLSDLQVKFDNLSFSYQIKARSILTREQLERLPQDCSLEFEAAFGIGTGIGRTPRRGER